MDLRFRQSRALAGVDIRSEFVSFSAHSHPSYDAPGFSLPGCLGRTSAAAPSLSDTPLLWYFTGDTYWTLASFGGRDAASEPRRLRHRLRLRPDPRWAPWTFGRRSGRSRGRYRQRRRWRTRDEARRAPCREPVGPE